MEAKEYIWKVGMDHTHWSSPLTERFNPVVSAISMGEPEPDISSDASDQVILELIYNKMLPEMQ